MTLTVTVVRSRFMINLDSSSDERVQFLRISDVWYGYGAKVHIDKVRSNFTVT